MPSLTRQQLNSVLRAAAPLERNRRQHFVDEVTATLAALPGEIGPGRLASRRWSTLQRRHFNAPRFADAMNAPRWSRSP